MVVARAKPVTSFLEDVKDTYLLTVRFVGIYLIARRFVHTLNVTHVPHWSSVDSTAPGRLSAHSWRQYCSILELFGHVGILGGTMN